MGPRSDILTKPQMTHNIYRCFRANYCSPNTFGKLFYRTLAKNIKLCERENFLLATK